MALFKIFKGLSSDLLSNKTNAVEGYVYYTTDESKFYIDIGTATTAVIGENRMPLNAYKADTLYDNNARYIAYPNQEHYYWGPDTDNPGQTKVVNNPTGYLKIGIPMSASQNIMITFTIDIFLLASKNTSKISYTLSGLYRQSGNWDTSYGLTVYSSGAFNYKNLPVYFTGQDNNYVYIYIGNSTTAWSYINAIIRDVLYSYWSSTIGYNYGITKNWIITNANILPNDAILAHEVNSEVIASSATIGDTNIPVYLSAGTITAGSTYAGGTLVNLNGSNMGATAVNIYAATSSGTSGLFLISNGENSVPTWVSNITVPGTLNVIGLTTLNDNVTVDGLITTNELIIQGQGSAQTPTAALHIATKGYVDSAISLGTAAQVGAILTIGSYTYNGSTAINIPIYDGTYS